MDMNSYAVKKIALKMEDFDNAHAFSVELQKVLREVRYLAKLKHQGVVGYNQSWIEIHTNNNEKDFTQLMERPANINLKLTRTFVEVKDDDYSPVKRDKQFFDFNNALAEIPPQCFSLSDNEFLEEEDDS
jgi:hypothetical protein